MKEAFHEQQMRVKENELCEKSASVQQLESQLDARKEDNVRLERACTAYKTKLDSSRLLASHWQLTSARYERIIAGHERDKANKQRYAEMMATHGKPTTKPPVPTIGLYALVSERSRAAAARFESTVEKGDLAESRIRRKGVANCGENRTSGQEVHEAIGID